MAKWYASYIEHAVERAKIHTQTNTPGPETYRIRGKETDIIYMECDTVTAVLDQYDIRKHMAVLNFASYKNPGGMFLEGSMAQEEALCHESTLYNVLDHFRDSYYSENSKHLNRALYTNKALWTPNIRFQRDDVKQEFYREAECSMITCAAPNYSAAAKYQNVSPEENDRVLYDRCRFVLSVAAYHPIDTLVLGAFGCGVFGQDAYRVGQIWGSLLAKDFSGVFERVVFACLPGKNHDDLVRGVTDGLAGNAGTDSAATIDDHHGWF
jgi:uncharacterized protein (TIGR02452 family)